MMHAHPPLTTAEKERVYAYLAGIPLRRKVSRVGQIQLGSRTYAVGRPLAQQTVTVVCDATTPTWVVTDARGTVVTRLPVEDMDVPDLNGIAPPEADDRVILIQLSLPLPLPLAA